MNFILHNPLLIWLAVVAIEITRHAYLIKVKRTSPNKTLSFLLRTVLMIAILYIAEWRPLYPALPAYVFPAWLLHDAALGLIIHGHPMYLNDTGTIDRLQRKYFGEFPWFVWKLILALCFVGIYFFNYV